MWQKAISAVNGGGGQSIDFTAPDVYGYGQDTGSGYSASVTQKPRYIAAVLNSGTNAYDHCLAIVDVENSKAIKYWRYSGSYRKDVETLPQSWVSVSDTNVSLYFYNMDGGRSPYYSVGIYY